MAGFQTRMQLAFVESHILVAEQDLLACQLRGSYAAIGFAAARLREAHTEFLPKHRRIQETIFDLYDRNVCINLTVIDRALMQTIRPDGERGYIQDLARRKAEKNDADLNRRLHDTLQNWRDRQAQRKELMDELSSPVVEQARAVDASAKHEQTEEHLLHEHTETGYAANNAPSVSLRSRCELRETPPAANAGEDKATFFPLPTGEGAGGGPPPGTSANPFRWIAPHRIARRRFLLNNHAAKGFVSGTIAPGGVGKTALVLAECLSLACATDVFNRGPLIKENCWYIGLEDPLDEYRRRIAAAVMLHGLDIDAIEGGFFLNVGEAGNFVMTERGENGTRICRPMVEQVVDSILERDIGLVVVDPFVLSHRASENDNTTIAAMIRAWSDIAARTNAAIELVHHTRKGATDAPTADAARGASAIVNAMRAVRMLVPMSEEEGQGFEVYDQSRYFKIVNTKSNLVRRGAEPEWREIVGVPLGNLQGL